MVELVQKVTELNLKCDKMELGDSSQPKTLITEFDANLTTFHGISSFSGRHNLQKECKNRVSAHLKSAVTKKLTLVHFMIISDTFEEPKFKLVST